MDGEETCEKLINTTMIKLWLEDFDWKYHLAFQQFEIL
jgi:hypothetical protein